MDKALKAIKSYHIKLKTFVFVHIRKDNLFKTLTCLVSFIGSYRAEGATSAKREAAERENEFCL